MSNLKNVAWRVRDFFRRDAVLAIACVLATASCVVVPPDAQYATYIDWRTIGLLFSLMVATSGLGNAGVLTRACRALVRACQAGEGEGRRRDAHESRGAEAQAPQSKVTQAPRSGGAHTPQDSEGESHRHDGIQSLRSGKAEGHQDAGIRSNGATLIAALTALTFFASMVVTNDVALVAFVPLALSALRQANLVQRLPFAIVCMTIAANTGSMLTPIGNPQNIYLLSVSGMAPTDLIATMAPYSALALALLVAAITVAELRNRKQTNPNDKQIERASHTTPESSISVRSVAPWAAIIAVCLLCVARIIPVGVAVIVAFALALAFDRRALRHVDYALLLTFVAFFIFVGNIARIDAVREAVAALVDGRALLVGAAVSQVISNVPAAIMLSGFTSDWAALLVGVNIGGLGTLVASMASLISYRQVAIAYPKLKGHYLRLFLSMNFAFLAALVALALTLG